ncbi:radical SAM/SPASM domain-containing protein [Sulfurisphaera ohwakuensis]|uniref:Radical SAM protein n=1 Tax=Sulfurisphaera ohwakuensis TaxID=69656 RepID=A0A650CKN0_SULOH|nr:radical SAM protein [Sulfurisphaera ohwakuensis]MBB5253657.1 radical SAM protein with 4Fe4S-binding SPASM domain [Sulfurisphaera ohwakuensis]QGR18359.1 radical SAM protein [Sulfurisphaera ohwakuensis]
MIPISVLVSNSGTVSFTIKGEYNPKNPSKFSQVFRPVITWNITYKCNLKCLHCYINASPQGDDGLTKDEALNLVDQMAEIKIPLLIMSGGEPLMRRDFFEIAKYASKKGLKLALSTNGTLISKKVAEELKEIGFLYIGISLDSPYPEFHDKFRGVEGAFDLTVKGIKNAIEAGLNVGLRFTITSKNIDQIDDYIRLSLNLGVKRITFYHISASGRGKELKDWMYTPEQYRKFMNKLIEYAKELKGKIEIETTLAPFDGIYIAKILAKDEKELEDYLKFVENSGGCGRKMISIYPNGDVYPCQFIDFYKLGNVREKPLKEIIQNIPDFFVNTDKYLTGKCATCEYKTYCKGGDRARAYYWSGNIYGDDPLCPLKMLHI